MGAHILKRTSALLLLLLLPAPARPADLRGVLTDYTFAAWSQKDGLAAGSVWSIAQDADGYLWVGTDAGLFRFDGVRFVPLNVLEPSPGPRASARAVSAASDGAIWAGFGESGGVVRIQNEQVRHFGENQGLPRGAIAVLVEDAERVMWAGHNQGLFRLEQARWQKWPSGRGLPDGPIYAAHLNKRGALLVGTAAGIYRLSRAAGQFELIERSTGGVPRSVSDDATGALYVTDGIAGFRVAGGAPPRSSGLEPRGRGHRLLHDRRGNLWVGTLGQGLWRVGAKPKGGVVTIERATALTGLLSDGVLSLFEDREGNVWVGTSEGLNRLVPRKITQITDLGLVTSVESGADGGVWVGTVDELVRFSDAGLDAPSTRIPLGGARLRTMHGDGTGLWAATDERVVRLRRGTSSLVPLPATDALKQISLITTDAGGAVWLYDQARGLVRWSNGRAERVDLPEPVRNVPIVVIYADRRNRVWLAFSSGQLGFFEAGGALRLFGAAEGFNAGVCRAMYEDSDGVIWFAAAGGLSRFVGGRFVTLTPANGLLANLTAIIDDDERNLWIGSGVGILRLHRGEFDKAAASPSHKVEYTLFDRMDGIAGTPLASYSTGRPVARAGDGRLWFVTGGGLTVIDPRGLSDVQAPAPIRVEQVIADGRRLPPSAGTALSPRTASLEIDYSVINLTTPLRINFRYRLDGFDTDWVDAGRRRQAFYTRLPPRKYRFQVAASNSEGLHLSQTAWDFSIEPAFYQTVWFRAAIVIASILIVWAAWRLRLRQVRREFSLLLGERARLSREIHDTLLQSLVGVALQFDALAADAGAGAPASRDQFVRMRKKVEEYIREARQSIWNLRSPTLERRDLVAALRDFGEQATSGGAVSFDLSVRGTPQRQRPKVEEHLLRIGQEAVTNAIRHAQPSRVQVELEYDQQALTLRVSDDGRGFDAEPRLAAEPNGHYGLVSMKERAAEVRGSLDVASNARTGTRITVRVPTRGAPAEAHAGL